MKSITERIETAAERALRQDPDDWAAAGTAAEAASRGHYVESADMVDRFAGDGRTVSAGDLLGRPVQLIVEATGEVRLVYLP